MSATPGKVCVDGVTEVAGQRVSVLHFIQCRDADLVGKPFFAHYDPDAVWLDDLTPAFADRFPRAITRNLPLREVTAAKCALPRPLRGHHISGLFGGYLRWRSSTTSCARGIGPSWGWRRP
jgi:hypothetical protein